MTAKSVNYQPFSREFDAVILAGHADQSLGMLAEPTETQKRLLSAFQYESNTAFLHTDTSVMPRTRRCWAAWNYHIMPAKALNKTPVYDVATHYWMNRLQGVSQRKDYLVSINGEDRIRPEAILKTIRYHHPIFDGDAVQAQESLPQLNQEGGQNGIYFCGSYFRYGFHEDAFNSALSLCEQLLGEVTWKR